MNDNVIATAQEMLKLGAEQRSANALQEYLAGRCFFGRWRPPFHYVICFDADGTMWGENNYGTQDRGHWGIDAQSGALSVVWQSYWENLDTLGYALNGVLHLHDVKTGAWGTSLLKEINAAEVAAFQQAPIHPAG
ncbi:hypothetical protein [Profundibacter amoris]|uniref:Uncharacterized protein n=1 Tax=Profundibacter amoris TaxID=2171755 RepID=A0A347UGF9_9RHOB|nr:hypothetical protein [Profundibacter amoris]AXX97937.1 hypothetical protein BAR1_08325 [Profundibacter amoris]